MLWTPVNEFNSIVDNFGSITQAGLGATVTAHASANTKGTAVELLSALADSCYFLEIVFTRTNTNGQNRSFLCDIVYDPAGGTNWQVLIPNLLVFQPSVPYGGVRYAFPIYIPAGSTVGCQIQCTVGGLTLQAGVRAFGKPSNPELMKCGSKVQALGVDTGTSLGTSVTPGSNGARGSYTASLGTLNFDAWWWQAGMSTTDTTTTLSNSYWIDVAVNATNKILCLLDITAIFDSGENCAKAALGGHIPTRKISSGQDVYIRMACNGTPDAGISAGAYALGG